MTATTRGDIANLLGMLKACFPNYHPERETAEVFYRLLADLPKELLEAAVIACVSEPGRAFAPTVGEIRGRAGELGARAGAPSGGPPSALEAYNEVMEMPPDMTDPVLRTWQDENGELVIGVRRLRFSHPLVERVARRMGWPQTFPGDIPGADRAQFTRYYEAELQEELHKASQHPSVRAFLEGQTAPPPRGRPQLRAGDDTLEPLGVPAAQGGQDDEDPQDQ